MTADISAAVTSLLSAVIPVAGDHAWDEQAGRASLRALGAAGWLRVGIPEHDGGEGGEVADAAAVVGAVTAQGWPSPAGDQLLVSNRLLSAAGLGLEVGDLVVAVPETALRDPGTGRFSVEAAHVSWAPWASHLVVVAPDEADGRATLAILDIADAVLTVRRTLNREPAADVALTDVPAVAVAGVGVPAQAVIDWIRQAGALARSVQTVAALQRIRDLTVTHIRTREQFGRPLSGFQAVQQLLAELAGEVEVAAATVRVAVSTAGAGFGTTGSELAWMAARARVSLAAESVARIAHQLHGALGTTMEHELHRHTLAVLSWRDDHGGEARWTETLSRQATAADDFWTWLADAPATERYGVIA